MDFSVLARSDHSCSHCRPYWRGVQAGSTIVEGSATPTGLECPACGGPLIVILTGGVHRCLQCGTADLRTEGHVVEFWWGEDPAGGALSIGWGGSDIWACSCGARDEDQPLEPFGSEWADAHAAATSGRVIRPHEPAPVDLSSNSQPQSPHELS